MCGGGGFWKFGAGEGSGGFGIWQQEFFHIIHRTDMKSQNKGGLLFFATVMDPESVVGCTHKDFQPLSFSLLSFSLLSIPPQHPWKD